MNDATRAKLDQLQELLAQRSEIEEQIEILLGGAATPPVRTTAKPSKGAAKQATLESTPKRNKCGLCGKSGHSRRTCDSLVAPTFVAAEKDSPLPDNHEEEMAEAIREEWAEGGRSSIDVANELAITLTTFNRIVEKYKIVRQ